MVQGRAAGNGNFNIDAIARLANAMENAPAVIDQPFVDPMADAFATDVEDMVDELRFNPSSNLAEEAAQIMNAPGAAKLGAGVMADLRAAVQLQEEKAANGSDAFTRGDRTWDEQKEKREKDRKALDDADEYADKVQNARQQEQQRQERAEAWANSDHTYAGQRMSASEWLRMIQWFKQPENRKAWEDAMMAETGQSREKVRATGDKIDRLDALIEKESRGEKLTPEEEAEKRRLNNDKDVQAGMAKRREQMDLQQGMRPEVSSKADAQAVQTSADTTAETASVNARMDILAGANGNPVTALPRTSVTAQMDGQTEFSTAPSLRDHHRASLAATTPLDQPAPPVIASAAPVAPVAAANAGGFDV